VRQSTHLSSANAVASLLNRYAISEVRRGRTHAVPVALVGECSKPVV